MNNYIELAEHFFQISYQLKKMAHQEEIDQSLKGEIFTLLYLKKKNESILPSEISEVMTISTARVTAILNNLEKKRLIAREIDKFDRRKVQVKLTKLGKKEANSYYKKVINQIIKMFELIGKEDSEELTRITSKIANLKIKEG